MDLSDTEKRLAFLREAEQMKSTLLSEYTSKDRIESAAEHAWRLCLMAMVFKFRLRTLNFARVSKMCVLHDLGEAINGDTPAVEQQGVPDKSERERRDLLALMHPLPQQNGRESPIL